MRWIWYLPFDSPLDSICSLTSFFFWFEGSLSSDCEVKCKLNPPILEGIFHKNYIQTIKNYFAWRSTLQHVRASRAIGVYFFRNKLSPDRIKSENWYNRESRFKGVRNNIWKYVTFFRTTVIFWIVLLWKWTLYSTEHLWPCHTDAHEVCWSFENFNGASYSVLIWNCRKNVSHLVECTLFV